MSQEPEATSKPSVNGDPRLFLVSCPRVIHSEGSPITYLFVANASCPPEARRHENWGLVERLEASDMEIHRGTVGEAKVDLVSRQPVAEWRISVGNSRGVLFQERWVERMGRAAELDELVRRIPQSVLLIPARLVEAFTAACRAAQVSYTVHENAFTLCADCLEFGCDGCRKRATDGWQDMDGTKFHLV